MQSATTRDLLEAQRAEALLRIQDLSQQIDAVVEASTSDNADDEHDPEGATIAFERSQLDALRAQARRRAEEAGTALRRLESGTYGRCERCGGTIAAARLEARPAAATCIACASNPRRW